ncbi:MAG: hypothetical protein KF833_15255 [Verrucomicrobiae bacterium]|nr:hypothetical protein [Verrucomicrobiae bacterium]
MAVIMHLNFLCAFRINILNPVRDQSDRATRIPVTPATRSTLQLNCEDLAFLLTTEDANAIPNSAIAQQSYHAVLDHIQNLNDLLQVIYRECSLVDAPDLAKGVCRISGGARTMIMLISVTNAVYDAVDHAIAVNSSAFKELQGVAHKRFPKEGALYLDKEKIADIDAILGSPVK